MTLTGFTASRDIFDWLGNMSVDHNGLILPGRLVEDHFSQYCECLGFWTGDEVYPLTIPGSATLIRYRDRYFMACTRHQLKLVNDLTGICLTVPHEGKTKCITSGGFISFDYCMNEGDHHEIALFDFTEPANELPELRRLFFDFRGQHPSVPADRVVGAISYGYPFQGRQIDYEDGEMKLVKQKVLCRYAGQGTDDAVHIFEPVDPLTFDPDGMSGRPAFTVLFENGCFTIHLAGINVRAGRERIRVIKAGALQMLMETLISKKP